MSNTVQVPAEQAAIQVCLYGGRTLHFQGRTTNGQTVNRDYGMATSIQGPQALVDWLNGQPREQQSFASGDVKYQGGIAFNAEDGTYVLISGEPLNHEGGALIRITNDPDAVISRYVEIAAVDTEADVELVEEADAVLV